MEKKECNTCREVKLSEEFAPHERARTSSTCKTCVSAYNRQYRENNKLALKIYMQDWHKENGKDSKLRSQWGITLADYQYILEIQGGVCALCGEPPGKRMLAVDHDHSCCPQRGSCGACIRGLLCSPCNTALNRVEIPGWSERALVYLEGVDND